MNENLKPIPKFYPTLGILPTDYLNTMTFLEQITWICNYINKEMIPIITKLQNDISSIPEFEENVTNQLNDFQNQLNEYIGDLDEVKQEINELNVKINKNSDDIEDIKISINNIITEINSVIESNFQILKNYVDYNDNLLNNRIDNLEIGSIQVYDPTTGVLSPLQVVINNLYSASNTDGLTASEFDNLELTATTFDGSNITAREFDSEGKLILT